jgi:hypothetical protein
MGGETARNIQDLYDIYLMLNVILYSWWWTERLSETCRVLFQNKINLRYCLSGWFYKEIFLTAKTSVWYFEIIYFTGQHKLLICNPNTAFRKQALSPSSGARNENVERIIKRYTHFLRPATMCSSLYLQREILYSVTSLILTHITGFLTPEDRTYRLSRNVGKELPLLVA